MAARDTTHGPITAGHPSPRVYTKGRRQRGATLPVPRPPPGTVDELREIIYAAGREALRKRAREAAQAGKYHDGEDED